MVFLLGFFVCMFCFFFYGSHYIYMLLMIEFMLLFVFMFFGSFLISFFGVNSLFIFIMVMVCMGGFGIALIMMLSRYMGRDFWVMGFIF